jgi:hypothetical protein
MNAKEHLEKAEESLTAADAQNAANIYDERTRELLTLDAIAHALVALGMKET